MKKTLSLLLALSILLLSLCACNKTENATSTTEASRETTSTTDSTQNTTVGTIATVATEATTEPSVTQPTTEPPATEPPATKPPATEPPATEPPATEPPATEPPAQDPNSYTKIGTIIPVGGVYSFRHVNKHLFEGEAFPSTPSIGDYFYFGDYRYEFVSIHNKYGWDVYAESLTDGQKDKSSYGNILLSINNYPIIAMTSTFHSNTKLQKAPSIPSTVIDMTQTFHSCSALISAPKLPNGLCSMAATFADCGVLETYQGATDNTPSGDFSNYNIPSVISNSEIIGAFYDCPRITILPRSINEPSTTEPSVTEPPATEPSATEPPATEPPVTEPTATEPPVTEPPVTEPPVTEPVSDVLIINDTRTISDQTINSDVYITSTGVATFNNVTVNGNIYCYGQVTCSGCTANNVYAYAYGSMMSCGAFDGTHGKVSGGINCDNLTILDNALDYAFNKWGKK